MSSIKTTSTDAHLARIYYGILLEHARNFSGQEIRYGAVLERARLAHPNDDVVHAAIPISMGRRLDVIARFMKENNLPPLTCLAVNESGQPGESYRPVYGSWQADMNAVSDYDWSQWQGRWDAHIELTRRAATPLKRRKEQDALNLVHQAYVEKMIPKLSLDQKGQLVELLREGMTMEDAVVQFAKLV